MPKTRTRTIRLALPWTGRASGSDEAKLHDKGSEIEVSEHVARNLTYLGQARYVDDPPAPVAEAMPPAEGSGDTPPAPSGAGDNEGDGDADSDAKASGKAATSSKSRKG